jgi:predicted metal-dependent peptidase
MGQGESFDEHGWEEAKNMDSGDAKQLAEDIDSAIRQGSILASKAGSNKSERIIGELTAPTVNWREQLREFVTNVCVGRDASTWRRPNRRWLAQDIYMPSPISETVGEVLIGIDTSGSIGDKEINEFLSELKGIVTSVTPDKVRIVYWDTQIQQEEVYEPNEYDSLTASTTPRGGGGTCAHCVKEYVDSLTPVILSVVIMLTDGYLYGEFPEFGVPTVWGITSDIVSTSGVTVRISV